MKMGLFVLPVFLALLATPFVFAQEYSDNASTLESNKDFIITVSPGSSFRECEETPDGCYSPERITISVGNTITMTNNDKQPHTFTSGNPKTGPDGIFDSNIMKPGDSFEWTAERAGTFEYYSQPHPWSKGVIMVVDDSRETSHLTPTWSDDDSEVEMLKIENKHLKNRIIELESEIDRLNEKIQSLVDAFVENITQIQQYFVDKYEN